MLDSQEVIDKIKDLSSNLTTISDMAILLDVDVDVLRTNIRDKSTPASKAYYSAKAETAFKLRKQEIELATVGSPLAVQLTKDYLISMDSDEDL